MIVCSCNRLSDRTLARAAGEILAEPDRGIITPGAVFKTLRCRPDCGGCFPLVVEVIHKAAVDADIPDVRLERTARSGRVLLSARLAAALAACRDPAPAGEMAACGCDGVVVALGDRLAGVPADGVAAAEPALRRTA